MFIVKACSETESGLTKIFTVHNFGNTLAVTINFFIQNVKNLMYIREMVQKSEKNFFVFQIIASQLVVANSHNLEQDT